MASVQHGDICPETIMLVKNHGGRSSSRMFRSLDRDGPAINLQFSSARALQHGKLCPLSDAESLIYLPYFFEGPGLLKCGWWCLAVNGMVSCSFFNGESGPRTPACPLALLAFLALSKITENSTAEAGLFTSHDPNFGNDTLFSVILDERALLNTVEVSDNFKEWKLNRTQKRLLRGQIFQQLDRHLIGALVERWRSETNTFHFPLGELTITLEDVGFILGLPVTGRPVIAPPSEATNKRTARDFFTSIPQDQFSTGVLPDNYTDQMLVLYTQAFLLWVMGAILFPTTSKNTVSVKYLPLLGNLLEVGDYAWGAATLAYLYRALHKATRPDSKAICACLSLLQVWSYEHLATGAPTRRDGTDNVWPRLCAWEYSQKDSHYQRRDDPHHNITYYRGELDSLSPGQMRWAPYKHLARRVGESFVFTLSGLQRTPLIHFEVAEWQLPDRAMRHFECQ
ncbi:hypothetical protein RJ639_030248 [Escallonia herrerae]|uniref:Aminotransferase-like plant mobile domain-containing protein n=1 Tax=Escallonia herrerae TaxID=1293975 RepID=A0AA89BD10_9ASTE|nr:hypothetical protein RJ639_030248 [Escallonia herrerae]